MHAPDRRLDRGRTGVGTGGGAWHAAHGCAGRETLIAFFWAFLISTPILAYGGWEAYGAWRQLEDSRLAAIERAQAYERLVAAAPLPPLPLDVAMHGREVFATVCIACHGAQGRGVEGLGKNLVESDFVALQSDDEFHQYIITGRPDARPVPMPPRAGQEDLSDEDIRAVVTYVRGLQDPRRMPEMPAFVLTSTPSESQQSAALAAAGGDAELAGYIASGDALFHSVCIACHGKGGVGIAGNGKALVRNEFLASLDDEAVFAFIQRGRSPSDPLNTTGIQMPPKGGNPALSEDDILDIISYLRTLQGDTPGASPAK